MKKFITFKLMAAMACMLPATAYAGDGTQANPYTVSELNAQKDALAATGNTVWVKADLKGLGTDGTKTANGTSDETRYECAALFGDATGTFTAYSYQILANLSLSDLTNTNGLLISLTYQKGSHPYGNTEYPEHASNYEPEDELHFSLEEVHGALSIEVKNGYRGYHVPSSYIIPKDIVAIKVSAGYSMNSGAYVNCENVFDGATANYTTAKNTALVLLANDGIYPVVLSTNLYPPSMTNGNAMNGGSQAGVNTITTKNRYHFRFVATADKVGFERNGSADTEVVLDSKDEIFLSVNSLATNFAGYWAWETDDHKWISWTGKKFSDYHEAASIDDIINRQPSYNTYFDLQGRQLSSQPHKGLYIINGKKHIAK